MGRVPCFKRVLRNLILFSALLFMGGGAISMPVHASEGLEQRERLSLARSFVAKLKSQMSSFDSSDVRGGTVRAQNILPDGEILLLQPVLRQNIRPEGIILGQVENQTYLLSLNDFTDTLRLAINYDPDTKTASGWYINDKKSFDLSIDEKQVVTDQGRFTISDDVLVQDGDLLIPADELASWLGIDFELNVGVQDLKIKSDKPFPIEQLLARRETNFVRHSIPDPSLPRIDDGYKLATIPVVDVSTTSRYSDQGNGGRSKTDHSANIRTVNDLGRGTLTTQSLINNQDQLSSVRATYKQETIDGHLLGPLKAKRFELGDVITVDTPLGGNAAQELGFRVTNTDAQRRFSRPFTNISGTAIPGWDVELYRDNQFLGIQEIQDDGFYQFDDITLFQSDNSFRLVFYGPQGERVEENVFVPFDRNLQTQGEGIYDVSVSLNNMNTYRNARNRPDDSGALNISAQFEQPVLVGTTLKAGVLSFDGDDGRETIVNTGVSTRLAQTLLNLDAAIDDDGDAAAEFVARRDIKKHQFSNTLSWTGAGFAQENETQSDEYRNAFFVNGPLPRISHIRPNYSIGSEYSWNDDGDNALISSVGVNAGIRNVALNTNVRHITASTLDEDVLDTSLTLSAITGKNRLRLTTNYDIKPNNELRNILASYRRDLTKTLDLELGVRKEQQTSLTEYEAQLDWQAGFARISPSVRYNTNDDFFAGLNTRFGLIKDPLSHKIKTFDRSVTGFGIMSAFVYLDKNGDAIFNGDDEPLKDIKVSTPQNSFGEVTNENGVAFFSRLARLRLTDVFIEKETLQDPSWISGFEGVSVLPREGYVAQVEFPIHISGELDGTVYARAVQGAGQTDSAPVPLRNVDLKLYNDQGEAEQSVVTDSGGFYYFANVPPGRYFLIIDAKSAEQKRFIRPKPQTIEIGYDGTVIYGNDIYVETGGDDVPSEILADLDAYKERHVHVDFPDEDGDMVLNLGEYNSRLMMSVVWYKLKTKFSSVLDQGQIYVPPTQSFADTKTGKHTLRVGLPTANIDDAYGVCRTLMAQDQACKVEILPSFIKQAMAQ